MSIPPESVTWPRRSSKRSHRLTAASPAGGWMKGRPVTSILPRIPRQAWRVDLPNPARPPHLARGGGGQSFPDWLRGGGSRCRGFSWPWRHRCIFCRSPLAPIVAEQARQVIQAEEGRTSRIPAPSPFRNLEKASPRRLRLDQELPLLLTRLLHRLSHPCRPRRPLRSFPPRARARPRRPSPWDPAGRMF